MRLLQRLRDILRRETAIAADLIAQTADMPASDAGRQRLPGRRPAVRQRMTWEDGQGNKHIADVSFGFDEAGVIREVFCLAKREGTDIQGLVHDACISSSIALQRGARVADLAKSFGELRNEGEAIGRPASVMGYLLRLAAAVEADLWREGAG